MIPLLFKTPEECCGCRACSNICPKDAISFKEDRYGFLFPEIDENLCIGCGRCESVCAYQNQEKEYRRTPIKGYAAVLKDENRLKQSTSGGVFWAAAEWVIGHGGCVFGVVWDAEMNAVHTCAETLEQLVPMQGSKYVQSNVGNTYNRVKEELAQDRWVLFSGTPCQVAALRSILGEKEYEKLIAIDLVCHGVPNNAYFHNMLSSLEKEYRGKVVDLHFRHKNPDWLNESIRIKFKKRAKYFTKNIFHRESHYYMTFGYSNQCCRQSCASCKYASSIRVGDITIGDFWGYKKAGIKLAYKKGLSCLLVNNEKVLPILQELKLSFQEVPIDIIINGNYQLMHPNYKDERWDKVMDSFAMGEYEKMEMEFRQRNAKLIRRFSIMKLLPPVLLAYLRQIKK
jgi:coenzyme F420-reducing hydrogenase beta subunit